MKLRGIKIGDYHTGTDWQLTLTAKTLDPPEPKTNYVSVDGRDGDLDISEALTGEIRYQNRNATFDFVMTEGTHADRERLLTEILSAVHGRTLQIVLPDDVDHYLVGRCMVKNVQNSMAYGTFTIEANCEPWKYRIIPTVRSTPVTAERIEFPCVNAERRTVIPTFTVTGGTVNIEFGTVKVSLAAGTYQVPEIKFKTGTNLLTLYGTGSIEITWREAIL